MSEKEDTRYFKKRGYQVTTDVEEARKSEFCIDLRSDTVTLPTPEMRTAMANAICGDDVFNEDPTANELEKKMAQLLGKEESLFIPSGTMGNLIATLVHCQNRGGEAILGDLSHMFINEQGGMAKYVGIQANIIKNEKDGTFSIEEVKKNIREDNIHYPRTSLICVENTHNYCGGKVVPLKWLDEITKLGKDHGIPLHMDGSRIFNAAIAQNVPTERITRGFSSISVCFSKNLGAPVGAILAGTANFIKEARRIRKGLGGGMRQIGILAAAALVAIDTMTSRIKKDHENAKMITKMIHSIKSPHLIVDLEETQTNFVMIKCNGITPDDFCERIVQVKDEELKKLGHSISVLAFPYPDSQVRLVLHSDITTEMATKAAEKICYVANELEE